MNIETTQALAGVTINLPPVEAEQLHTLLTAAGRLWAAAFDEDLVANVEAAGDAAYELADLANELATQLGVN